MPVVIAATRDLIFASKISGTGQALGIPVQVVQSTDALEQAMVSGGARLVIVDMALPRELACDCLRRAAQQIPLPEIVAYYSHVDGSARDDARSAGAQQVLPRSKFTEVLPDLLRTYGTALP